MATSTARRLDQVKIAIYIVSAIVSTALIIMTWSVSREYENIQHRLDVDDAWHLKGVYDASKDWQAEAREQRAFAERLIEHCKTRKCELPDSMTSPPPSRNAPPIELMVSKTRQEQEK